MSHEEEDFEPAKRRRHDSGVPITTPETQQLPDESPKAESLRGDDDGDECFASNPEPWRGLAAGLGLHCQDAVFLEQLPRRAEQLAAEIATGSTHQEEPDESYETTTRTDEDITCAASSPSHLAAEGYSVWSGGRQFQDVCRRLRQAADRLRANGWPPLFLLAYDEAWLVAAALGRCLCSVTGLRYQCNLDFFAWHVLPGGRGWAPHRDRPGCRLVPCDALRGPDSALLQPSSSPSSLLLPSYITAWISLTESTRLNSCISVLSLTRDRNFGRSPEDVTDHRGCERDGDSKSSGEQHCSLPLHPEDEEQHQEQDELPDTELPVQPGQVILWGGRTLHCGGPSHAEAPEARISMAVAFSIPDDKAGGDDAELVRVDAFRGWSSAFRENNHNDCLPDDAAAGNDVGGGCSDGDGDGDGDDGNADEKGNDSCDGNSGWHLESEIAESPFEVRIRCIAMQLEFYSDVQPVPHHIQRMIDNM